MSVVSPRLLILTALLPEARAIARALQFSGDLTQPFIQQEDICIARIGLRARHLLAIAAPLRPRCILMAGLAGALSPALKIGDIVADGWFPPVNFDARITIHRGRLHSTAHLVSTPAEKAALFQQTHALAVDMETQLAADFATSRQIPFLALRAISDTAEQSLDASLLSLIDDAGNPRPAKAAMLLLRHPAKLSSLMHIKRATNVALTHLAATIVALLGTGWPDNLPDSSQPTPQGR